MPVDINAAVGMIPSRYMVLWPCYRALFMEQARYIRKLFIWDRKKSLEQATKSL
jgi:hypothetical protein